MMTTRPERNCPCCGLPDEAVLEMVQCDRCNVWYHFRCAGVTRVVKHLPWNCRSCQADPNFHGFSEDDNYSVPPSEFSSLRPHTGTSLRKRLQFLDEQFQFRLKRLADQKALEERILTLDEEYAKRQYDLREKYLKDQREMLTSWQDKSVCGSRVSLRNQESMRSERVRQWMDQQQNPVENPPRLDPRGAYPETRPTTQTRDLSLLQNPDEPQREQANKVEGMGRPEDEPAGGVKGGAELEEVLDSVQTTTFLTDVSTMRLVEDSLADALSVSRSKPLRLIWTADISRTEQEPRQINVLISTTGCNSGHELTLRTVFELELPTRLTKISSLTKQFTHLQDISVIANLKKPRVHLGLDNVHRFAPQGVRMGQPDESIVVKSNLGWSVYGSTGFVKLGTPKLDLSIMEQAMWKYCVNDDAPEIDHQRKRLEQQRPEKPSDVVFIADQGQLSLGKREVAQRMLRRIIGCSYRTVVRVQGMMYQQPVTKQAVIEDTVEWYGVNQIPRKFGTTVHGLGNVADPIELCRATDRLNGIDGQPACHRNGDDSLKE